jgi:hypothetical protein
MIRGKRGEWRRARGVRELRLIVPDARTVAGEEIATFVPFPLAPRDPPRIDSAYLSRRAPPGRRTESLKVTIAFECRQSLLRTRH